MKVRFLQAWLLLAALGLAPLPGSNGAAAWARNAPDFTLPTPEGKQISLSAQRGKFVVIEFLQTTCPHCQRAGRLLQKLYTEYGERNFLVIGISHDAQGMPAISRYTQEHGVTYPVVLGDLTVAVNYLGISPQRPNFHVPVFFFVGPDGQLLEEHIPDRLADRDWFANTEQNLEAAVRRLMPPPSKPAAKNKKRAGAGSPAKKPVAARKPT